MLNHSPWVRKMEFIFLYWYTVCWQINVLDLGLRDMEFPYRLLLINIFSQFDLPHNNSLYLIFVGFYILYFVFSNYYINMQSPFYNLFFSRGYFHRNFFVSSAPYFYSLFAFIFIFNFLGIIPYMPSLTSHFAITIILGLLFWFPFVFSDLLFNPQKFFAKLLPSGVPIFLAPFLIIIESLRILIRPLTLALRLAANLTAGHVILGLIAAIPTYLFVSLDPIILTFSFFCLFVFTLVELAVNLIQVIVFVLLVTIYLNDHTI